MTETPQSGYQGLARKYRPATFDDLIGQDAMVRTLRNAFAAGRIAQAFMLTGIRGTGKTTTARIIAKGLNCIGPDGTGGPTTTPCGVCDHCVAIAEGRHVDVMEMDAASNTGVQNIRDAIIDTVSYRAATARHKIFIIDEVHMLSTSAFNALLKTLEEPPAHVKFLFATTEIRKVPVTVLSRCQRFDLRRIEPEVMIAHLRKIATLEATEIAEDALALITRAAEGSVRDAVSLLDQAIAHGAGQTTADQVRAMLGLADRGRVMDLFDAIMAGNAADALDELGGQYADGADPMAILRDLAETTHWLSVIKISPTTAEDPTIAPEERERGRHLSEKLPMRVLSRTWQMLLKAMEEIALAPNAMMAAEMAIIRLTHVADLPTPGDLVRQLHTTGSNTPAPEPQPAPGARASSPPTAPQAAIAQARVGGGGGSQPALAVSPTTDLAHLATFESVVALIEKTRDLKLLVDVKTTLRLVNYAPGRIEFQPTEHAPGDLAARLGRALKQATGERWAISVTNDGGGQTLAESKQAEQSTLKAQVADHPLMQAVRAAFPNAQILNIRTWASLTTHAEGDALPPPPEEDETWDPFEESGHE